MQNPTKYIYLEEFLNAVFSDALNKLNLPAQNGKLITKSQRKELGDFQSNCAMALAKVAKKSPLDIAQDIVNAIEEENTRVNESANTDVNKGNTSNETGYEQYFTLSIAKPGFINIKLTESFLLSYCARAAQNNFNGMREEFPVSQATTSKAGTSNETITPAAEGTPHNTILIDYGGPNVAKPLHVGHLRSAIIGESIKRMALALGYSVIGDIHLGDWGSQMGLVVEELKDLLESGKTFEELNLNSVYPKASARAKEDEEFHARAQHTTKLLQENKAPEEDVQLWEKIKSASIDDLHKNYEELLVDFTLWKGESDAAPYIPKLISALTQENILELSDGAHIVEVSEADDNPPIPPVLIQKSDGAYLYATTDLATIIERNEDFAPQTYLYVVDNRQKLHFTQVFRCAKKGKLVPPNTNFEFLGFGTMNGKDGKPFKTREGSAMSLSTLIAEVKETIRTKTKDSEYLSKDELEQTVEKLAIAAIKFGDLSNQPQKDYIFEVEKFSSFEGKTGPYILYSLARINSLLAKAGVNAANILKEAPQVELAFTTPTEREIYESMAHIPDTIKRAFFDKSPNYLCEEAFNLASLFSRFYKETPILKDEDEARKHARLYLVALVKEYISYLLHLLAIPCVERM